MNVLVVDGDALHRPLVTRPLVDAGYQVSEADDGREAIDRFRQSERTLLVSDWDLPTMDGIQLCRAMRNGGCSRDGYFIMLTGRNSREDREVAAAAGVDRYMTKPFDPDDLVMQANTGRFVLNRTPVERKMLLMGRLAESRNPAAGDHFERIRKYSRILADQLRGKPEFQNAIDNKFVELIYMASALHDVGKLAVPVEILLKPGKVTNDEFEVLKTHTLRGAETLDEALDTVPDPSFLRMARDIAVSHHERYDGGGYPYGLAGDDIPLCGHIVALADVYDALTSRRTYRNALRHEEARSIIIDGVGTAFAPAMVRAFLDREADFVAVREQHADKNIAPTTGSSYDDARNRLREQTRCPSDIEETVDLGQPALPATDFRALLVDADAISRKMLSYALEQEGFECDAAEDEIEAQRKIAEDSYDLVVTDLRLSKDQDHSFAVELLQRQSRPAVVIHTSLDDPRKAKDLMSRGVDDIIHKPAQPAAFAAKAKDLVSRRRSEGRHRPKSTDFPDVAPASVGRSEEGVPREFGRYRILREIGRGNMATVYLAHDSRLEREVALKIVRTDNSGDNSLFRRFREEAKAVATLSHAGICPVYDLGAKDGHHYIAMAYITGHPLSHYIVPEKLQPERKAALAVLRLARALDHAHRRGVVHRDLKPSNIIIDADGQPVITDFGLACRIGQTDIRLTQAGELVGTPAYMSPEQANGDLKNIGPPSDVYSLGVILYQLLTGRLPFEGSVTKVIIQIISNEPTSPSVFRPDLEPELEELCLAMMAKLADDRPATMESVADTIAKILTEEGR